MSAGDVLFVGWTGGGGVLYKELVPSTSYEPVREVGSFDAANKTYTFPQNYTWKRVTRRLICFNKDKDAVISNVTNTSGNISSVYIDTDGSTKTLNLGSGWEVLNYDDSEYAKGFTVVQVTYRKAVDRSIDFGLPSGLSITCLNGVCKINYNNTVLEEIDSGTGVCGEGLNIEYERFDIPDNPELALESVYARAKITCNGVVADYVDILGSEIPEKDVVVEEEKEINIKDWSLGQNFLQEYFLEFNEALKWIVEKRQEFEAITPELQEAIAKIKKLYVDSETTKYTNFKYDVNFPLNQIINLGRIYQLAEVLGGASYQYIARLRPERDLLYQVETTYPKTDYPISAQWEISNNIIRLKVLNKILREYDVTGLT